MTSRRSHLWAEIASTLFSKIDDEFLKSFRSPGGANRRLAAWDPFDKSMRYYKFLLYNVASQKPDEFFNAYKRLNNTGIGAPVTVSIENCRIDIDYLFAVEEYLFLQRHLDFSRIKKIVEIGAGFGRTCHALLSLADSIQEYVIIDLPEILKLSQAYLLRAIPDKLNRVVFIESDNTGMWEALRPDLTINIDSFQEMPTEIIDCYMNKVVSASFAFYCKNPMGKYRPDCVGLPKLRPDQLLDVYSLGYCQKIFDLFDKHELSDARKFYLEAYRPRRGRWELTADESMDMFPYIHHALYVCG